MQVCSITKQSNLARSPNHPYQIIFFQDVLQLRIKLQLRLQLQVRQDVP